MSTLTAPLPPLRHRASSTSTSVRPPSLSLCPSTSATNVDIRASSYILRPDPIPDAESLPMLVTPIDEAPSVLDHASISAPDRTLARLFLRRVLDLLPHGGASHDALPDSPPSMSPRSSSESDTILPLSAPPEKTSFGDVLSEKARTTSSRPRFRLPAAPSVHAPILFVITLFPLTTAIVALAISTLPISVSWPHNLAELASLGRELHTYTQSGWAATWHVAAVVAVSAVWKHAWSIPGSVLWNVLAGALFTPTFATVLLTLLTTIGSLAASMLAKPLEPLLTQFFPKALAMTRHALEGGNEATTTKQQSPAWVRLTVLRLIGVVPWSGLNIACGVCGVSWWDCTLGAFIGTLPWTAVTCQIGDILQTVASAPGGESTQTIGQLVASPEILAKLAFLSVLSLAPILCRDRLRAMLSPATEAPIMDAAVTMDAPRKKWRMHLRMPSRSRPAMHGAESQRDLATLIEEKNRAELDRA